MERIIYLQKIGKLEDSILINLKSQLEQKFYQFKIKVTINRDQLTLTDSEYNELKQQFDASKILNLLKREFLNKNFFRLLGILDEDIYSKNYNFIFGLARMKSKVAVISLTRLREDFYKKTSIFNRKHETGKIFEDRILKEAIHELGHTFQLKHCTNVCVMRFSNSLKDTDKKPSEFCNSCSNLLKQFLK